MKRQNFTQACLIGLLCTFTAKSQQLNREMVRDALDKKQCVVLEPYKVRICPYDYTVDKQAVEAVSFQPSGEGRFPAALLIPGYSRAARDLVSLGVVLAANGIACIAVTQPGFGKSQGPADYVGPKTIKVLTAGFRKFQREPFVDGNRMGIYGYSRGAMAASLMAVELDDVKAAVFGAGVYDFRKAYDEVTIAGIRDNMKAETGMTEEAIRQRSSILKMERLKCPVLILHGEKDVNVPVSQALQLRDRLRALQKEFEVKVFPDREHGIGPEVSELTLDFFKRKLR